MKKQPKHQNISGEAIAKPFPSPRGTFDFSSKQSQESPDAADKITEHNAAPTVMTATTSHGKAININIPDFPLMLVDGNPSDRTYFIKRVLCSLFLSCSAEELKALVLDMSGNFREFNGVFHMASDIIESQDEMPYALKAVSEEIARRRELLKRVSADNYESYNRTAEQKLPRVLVILAVGAQDLAREELPKIAPASDVGFYFIVMAAWRIMPELVPIAALRAVFRKGCHKDECDKITFFDVDGRETECRAEFVTDSRSVNALKYDTI